MTFTEGSRVVRVGRYTWDEGARKAFMKGDLPLAGARFETSPTTVRAASAAEVAHRLHDTWFVEHRESAASRAGALLPVTPRTKLSPTAQKESVNRLYKLSLKRSADVAAKLRTKYLSKPGRSADDAKDEAARRDSVPAVVDEADRCNQIADRLDDYRAISRRKREKLEAKLLVEPWRERTKRLPRESLERFCASLYQSHRNVAAAQSAAAAAGDLDLVGIAERAADRSRRRRAEVEAALRPSRSPSPRRSKEALEAYGLSLHLSHKNDMVANLASNLIGNTRVGARVGTESAKPWEHGRPAVRIPQPPPRVPIIVPESLQSPAATDDAVTFASVTFSPLLPYDESAAAAHRPSSPARAPDE
jgi:hypothetical protein